MTRPQITDLTFRRAEERDLPAIVAILADDYLGATREHLTDPLPPCYADAFHEAAANPNAYMLVCERAGKVVGFLQLWFLRGIAKQGALQARVGDVQVASAERGAGVGRRMMERAIELARERGCKLVFLISHHTRTDAHRFYQRLGFTANYQGMMLML